VPPWNPKSPNCLLEWTELNLEFYASYSWLPNRDKHPLPPIISSSDVTAGEGSQQSQSLITDPSNLLASNLLPATEEMRPTWCNAWGDPISSVKPDDTLRIGVLNLNGWPKDATDPKNQHFQNLVNTYDFDVMVSSATNRYWPQVSIQDRLYERTFKWWQNLHISLASNEDFETPSDYLPGGVLLMSRNHASHRVSSQGQDPTGLGRSDLDSLPRKRRNYGSSCFSVSPGGKQNGLIISLQPTQSLPGQPKSTTGVPG